MAAWAVVSALTAVAKDYKGLLLTRFFLGIAEAPYYPGMCIRRRIVVVDANWGRCSIHAQLFLHPQRNCHQNLNPLHR